MSILGAQSFFNLLIVMIPWVQDRGLVGDSEYN